MKKIAFGFAAALALGLASFTVPASAATTQQAGVHSSITDFSAQRMERRMMRRSMMRRGPVCTMRTVVRRGPMGRRVVTKTRVCR